jgi:glycosyltransferase involved in cell wall biosynthesis
MAARDLTVYYQTPSPEPAAAAAALSLEEIARLLYSGRILLHLWRYRDAQLLADRIDNIPRPSVTSTVVRLLGRRNARFLDAEGREDTITYAKAGSRLLNMASDFFEARSKLDRVRRDVRARLRRARNGPPECRPYLPTNPCVFLRTVQDYGTRAGGSVGHIAGVLNNLDRFTGPAIFFTTAPVPTVRADIETHLIPRPKRLADFPEERMAVAPMLTPAWANRVLAGRPLSLVYQRYSPFDYTGLLLAEKHHVPFVVEYNGSEVWVARNWGRPFKHEALALDIELLNLLAADVVVVVSKPMLEELVARGVPAEKVLVNPNGVNPDHYSPAIGGEQVRKRYGFGGQTVVGFIGTFGPWHGAEVLADAFGRLLAAHPEYRDRVRLLLIGDGSRMGEVKAHLARHKVADRAVLTGIVPQAEGPAHLAACDLLASPHVPNPDGTPFFGSPTKLFEYMAMGKGIVASDLDQIGEVLEHDRTAWMVRPGDAEDLARGLRVLLDDPERRRRIGAAARAEVVARYTWEEHTRKIIDKLASVCPPPRPEPLTTTVAECRR